MPGPVPSLSRWEESSAGGPAGAASTFLRAPSVARMYDYFLGGKDNYAIDREMADRALDRAPVVARLAQVNRGFLEHAAARLAESGLRQFVDVGCGLPARRNVGDIVRRAHKAIEGQHGRTVARRNQERRDGEILVMMAFTRLERCSFTHAFSPAWARPFHMPPFPDQCWIAESSVKAA